MSDLTIPPASAPAFTDYLSPVTRPGVFARICPTAAFYGRVAREVFSASAAARRGRFKDEEWYRASVRIRCAFELAGACVQVEGTHHLATLKQPAVYIGNHMSTAETFLLASMILPFCPVTFVVKQALVEYPVFKHIMISRNPVVVGRVNPREDLKAVIDGGRERLAAGTSIVIFPQRTRTVAFDRESFNTIGVKLASRSGVPVVPLALKTNAWSNGRLLKDFGPFLPHEPVRFAFGQPILPGGSDRDTHNQVISFIEARLCEWKVPLAALPS